MTQILTIASVVWLKMLRKKDIYVLLILTGALLTTLISLDIFGLGKVTGYIKEMGLLMAWLFGWILAVNVSSREIPEEETRGTIFPLLAKPITRFQFLCGKLLGSFTIVAVAILVFYVLVFAVVISRGGTFDFKTIAQGYALHCAALAVLSAMSLAFSTRMNYDAAASISYVLSGVMFLLVRRIPVFITYAEGIRANALMIIYNLLPHLEIFDMRKRIIHDYGPLNALPFCGILAYGLLLSLLFLMLAWLSYRQKRFSRGTML